MREPRRSRRAVMVERGSAFLVGRSRERVAAERLITLALSGRGSLMLLAGPAGIGKTTVADWVMKRAERRGVDAQWGRAWESGGAPAYWPFVQALRAHHERIPPSELDRFLATADPSLGRLLPELAPRMKPLSPDRDGDPVAARFRLFAAVAAYLRWGSRRRPIALALDDLHAADASSLLLLDFLATELASEHVLLLGAYRPEEAERSEPVALALTRLLRPPNVVRMDLDALSRDDVAEYVALVMGEDLPDVGRRVFDTTEGHPLFVREYVRLLLTHRDATSQPPDGVVVPREIRTVFHQRLKRLPDDVVTLLEIGAVLGRDFDAAAAGLITDLTAAELLSVLQPAVDERVVAEVTGNRGRLRFAHVLLRDVVYESIPLARRMELHLRTADTLEGLHPTTAEQYAAEVAHHLLRAGDLADARRVIAQVRRAGEHALQTLAYDEAAGHFASAAEIARRAGTPDAADHCDLLLRLGDAAARAGSGPAAKDAFSEAAELAKRHGLTDRLARAALGYSGRFVWARAGRDRRVIVLLRRALGAIPVDDSTLRVSLLSRLAGALRDEADRSPRDDLSREALEMARRLNDPEAIAHALDGRCAALLWADNAMTRHELAGELVAVAETHDLHERAFQGHYYRALALMELGDMHAMKRELDVAEGIATDLRLAPQLWLTAATRATLALFEGRFREADALIERALTIGSDAQASDAGLTYALQRATLARERGRLVTVEALLRRAAADYPARSMFPALLAAVAVERGLVAEARRTLRAMAVDPVERLGWTPEWTFTIGVLAEVATAVGDTTAADSLYQAARPLAHLNAATSDEVSSGSVERSLGLLAGTMGRRDDAVDHLERAVTANERMGARPWAAYSQHDLARALAARNRPGDVDSAVGLLHAARRTAAELDMPRLDRMAEAALRDLGAPLQATDAAEPEPQLVVRRDGDAWSVAFGADVVRVRHSLGMRFLARLVSTPSRELHAVELSSERADPSDRPTWSGDAGPLLDRTARAAYRDRLATLDVDIAQARNDADVEATARLALERRAVERELKRALGLGGRDRRAAQASERARVSVTRALRTAIERIAEKSPGTGEHLRRAIRTGTFCAYVPDRDRDIGARA